jgi:ABC-type multidrug transport system fused ATPase/permease subunit
MVLSGGRVREFDSPDKLLANASSEYYEMAKESFIV